MYPLKQMDFDLRSMLYHFRLRNRQYHWVHPANIDIWMSIFLYQNFDSIWFQLLTLNWSKQPIAPK